MLLIFVGLMLTRLWWCSDALSHQQAAVAIESWMDELVIGHNLCPWAARSHRKIVVVDSDLDEEIEALRVIAKEASALAGPWHTTLCVLPRYSQSLPLFQRLWKRCESSSKLSQDNDVHVLAFHPLRRDRKSDSECVQFAMRSPLACIQLLQRADLEQARKTSGGERAMLDIMSDNEATLKAIGLEKLRTMYQSWLLPSESEEERRMDVKSPIDVER